MTWKILFLFTTGLYCVYRFKSRLLSGNEILVFNLLLTANQLNDTVSLCILTIFLSSYFAVFVIICTVVVLIVV